MSVSTGATRSAEGDALRRTDRFRFTNVPAADYMLIVSDTADRTQLEHGRTRRLRASTT